MARAMAAFGNQSNSMTASVRDLPRPLNRYDRLDQESRNPDQSIGKFCERQPSTSLVSLLGNQAIIVTLDRF